MKTAYDKHARPSIEYAEGDKVYLEATNIKTHRPSKKLDDKRYGPFKIVKKVGKTAYELQLPEHWPAVHPVFNECYLTLYHPPVYPNQQKPPPPPPVEIEGATEYDVETVLDSRKRRNKMQYLVHWEGYPREDDTWEPVANLKHAQELIDEFHEKHPDRPAPARQIRAMDFQAQLKDLEANPKLFNYLFGTPGEEFQQSKPLTNVDAIIPFSPSLADHLLSHPHNNAFLPQLPTEIRRVWIYETEPVNAVTMMIRLDAKHVPTRLYQLLDPLTDHKLLGLYGCKAPSQPRRVSSWIVRDYAPHCYRIW
jgi:hypothetical protein